MKFKIGTVRPANQTGNMGFSDDIELFPQATPNVEVVFNYDLPYCVSASALIASNSPHRA
jgi:hypothetical protein